MDKWTINNIIGWLHSPIFITVLLFLILSALVALDSFFGNYLCNKWIRLSLYLLVLVWVFIRRYLKFIALPRNSKNKVGIVVAIYSHNQSEEIKVKNDFIEELKRFCIQENLENFKIITLQNEYCKEIGEKVIDQFQRKIQAHYYIYWNIRRGNDWEPVYLLNISAKAYLRSIDLWTKQKLEQDFSWIFLSSARIPEKYELKWFKLYSFLNFITIKYICWIASIISWNPFLWIKLLELTNKERDNPESILKMTNYETIFNKIPPNITYRSSIVAESIYNQHRLNNIDQLSEYVNKWIFYAEQYNCWKESYWILFLKSILLFKENKPEEALKILKKAKKIKSGDKVLQYNILFLNLRLWKYKLVANAIRKILRHDSSNEILICNQVQDFIVEVLKENSEKIQFHYWLGIINYKKYWNLVLAKEDFKVFLDEFKKRWEPADLSDFATNAKEYIVEIETAIWV